MIYVVSSDCLTFKIGYTGSKKSLNARVSNLRTGSSKPLTILSCCKGTLQQERALHGRLAQYRQKGEWFSSAEWVDPLLENVVAMLGWQDAEFVLDHTDDQLRAMCLIPPYLPIYWRELHAKGGEPFIWPNRDAGLTKREWLDREDMRFPQ